MSRITKEEIEKTKCGRFLLSDENIYLSIYSLNSYVFEYNLLNTEDRILYHRLQDKFDARLINGVITRVREQIIELFDKDKYIEAKVYFKPKKLSENGELEFRPLHSTGLITQIAIVSMLHLFVYEIPEEEEGDPKLRLSNLSRLIPSDFYGNRVSVKPEYLFKPWKQQYQKYNQNSNDALMKYHTSLEYKYEVTLDLENFFPTINPIIIYRYIINHLPAYLNDEERKMMKRVLQKLLFCKLTTTFDEKTAGQNLYDAYRSMEEYTFGRKYSSTDVLSDMSNDNPDILMKFLFLLNNVIGLYIDKNYGMVISICKKENKYFDSSQFKIKKHADKKSIKNKFDKIIEIYEKDGCLIKEVIESLFDNGFIPEKVKNDFEENIEYQKVLDIEMKEVSNLANYLSMPHISTQHGVKGESHTSVIFVASDNVNTPNVRMYPFFELWSKLEFSLPQFEELFYSYSKIIEEVEKELGMKVSIKMNLQ